MNASKRKSLGRGLSALLSADDDDYAALNDTKSASSLAVEALVPGKYQPRHVFDDTEMQALVESVRARGVLQPLLVRPLTPGRYEIVAGERRWRAAQKAGLVDVPVIIKELDDRETLEIALVENIQRQDLTPLEEAKGYARLLAEFHYTQDELAGVIGKSRSHIANTLRLLQLPPAVQEMVGRGELSAGHARTLVTAVNPEQLARQIIDRQLTVREAEGLAQQAKVSYASARKALPGWLQEAPSLEKSLQQLLGLPVQLRPRGVGAQVTIQLTSRHDWEALLLRFERQAVAFSGPVVENPK